MNIIVILGVIATAIGAYYGYRQYKLAEKPGETAEQRPTPGAVPTATFTPVSEATPTPSFTPSPSPIITSGPAPAPTPHSRPKTEPEQKPSAAQTPAPIPLSSESPRERVPAPAPTEQSFVRRMPQNPCIKYNHGDDLSLGVPYRDTDVGFYVEYIAASAVTGANLRIRPTVLLKMPGEEKTREVNIYPGFKQSARTGGCLYTFSVKEVSDTTLTFSFNGSR